MPVVAEILLWLLIELAIQLAGEFLVALGFESLAQSLGRRERPHRLLAGLGCLLIGALAGGVVTFIYPRHVSPGATLPFFAVVILPLLVGAAAFWLGRRAEAAGRPRPALSTFWGGALFALGMSLTRFLLLRAGGA
jgi:hypothetical protein